MIGLIAFICLLESRLAFELIKEPIGDMWAIEGESFDASCEIDESWQWCYWQRADKNGEELKKFSTFRDHPLNEQLYSKDYGITFSITENICGLHIDSVDDDLHGGQWMCHLADTDINDNNNTAESPYFALNVATKSSIKRFYKAVFDSLSKSAFFEGLHFEYTQGLYDVLHSNVNFVCAGNATADPKPFLSLWVAFPFQEQQPAELKNSSVSE